MFEDAEKVVIIHLLIRFQEVDLIEVSKKKTLYTHVKHQSTFFLLSKISRSYNSPKVFHFSVGIPAETIIYFSRT